MVVFHVFKIVQIVANRTAHHICKNVKYINWLKISENDENSKNLLQVK